MKKSESLHTLIHALTKSEKRYFKLTTRLGEPKAYLMLFEAIESQDVYNEKEIKARFKNKAFIRQLTTIKNYLLNKILAALRNYHAHLSVSMEIMNIIQNIEILFHKGLYTICKSELSRAEKKATEFQQFNLLLIIKDWKRRVNQVINPQDFDSILKDSKAEAEVIETCKQYIDLISANIQLSELPPEIQGINNLQSETLRDLHLYQKNLISGKPDGARKTIEQLLEKWQAKKKLRHTFYPMYLSVFNTYLAFLVFQKQYEEALEKIANLKAQSLSHKTPSAAISKERLRLFTIELEIIRMYNDAPFSSALIQEIKTFISNHQKIVPADYWLSMRFQFATIYFFKKSYQQSLSWINHILNHSTKKDNPRILYSTHWLNLLIHFEMGNEFVLRYQIDAMQRMAKKQKNIASYEKIIWKFLSKHVHLSKKSKQIAFGKLKEDLLEEKISESILYSVDFLRWIDGNLKEFASHREFEDFSS